MGVGDRIDRVIEVCGVPVAAMRRAFVERLPLERMVTGDVREGST